LGESIQTKEKNKVMHWQYIRSINRQLISVKDTFLWLSKGGLKVETESELVAAQDPSVTNKILCNKNIEHRDR
jgi:hypothetical protein